MQKGDKRTFSAPSVTVRQALRPNFRMKNCKVVTWLLIATTVYLLLAQKRSIASAKPMMAHGGGGHFDAALHKATKNKLWKWAPVPPPPPRSFNKLQGDFFGDFLDDDEALMDVSKKDDYGHLRFGRGKVEFDDYGHMRFGRSGKD